MSNNGVQVLVLSSSRLHGHEYLQHLHDEIVQFLRKNNITKVLFIPFAAFEYEEYTALAARTFKTFGAEVVGIQTLPDPVEAIEEAQCVFIGGGNTFKLLKHLYDADLVEPIRRRVLAGEMAYMGSSAGTNVATTTINLTNDMPITWPPSYEAIGVVPIHLNTHYIDTDPDSLHQGETREDRINEFLNFCEYPVLALREGTALLLDNGRVTNLGTRWARLLKKGQPPIEIEPNTDLSYLLMK